MGLLGSPHTGHEDTGLCWGRNRLHSAGPDHHSRGGAAGACPSPSPCRPTGQGASTPAQPALLLILWERAMEATNLSCLIPHFSQCFKKHPWLTAEEGVWRPNASGSLCSLGQSISERASADVRAQEPLGWLEPCSPGQPCGLRKKGSMSRLDYFSACRDAV